VSQVNGINPVNGNVTINVGDQTKVYVEDYPRLGGETDDKPRIVRACTAAPEFAEIVFDPKVSYSIVGSVTNTKSLNLNLNGANFTVDPTTDVDGGTGHQVKGNPTFYFKGTIGTAYSIQSATEMATSVTMVTASDASNFSVGDYVIIEDSSNIQKWDNSGVGAVGYGEINVVSSISSGVITLSKPVEFGYSTTPTIKKMTPLINPKVYGASNITEVDPGYSYTGGGLTGYAPHPVHFEYCLKPEVYDCTFDKWQLHATNFHYCVAPNMRNVTGKNPFRTADAGSGYFMRFERCWGGKVEKCVSRKVRHMVDWVMSFDSVSDSNLAIEPQNIAIYTHGNQSKRCSSINDVVQGGTQAGFGNGNPSFAGDFDFTFINPTYHGANIGIVLQCGSQRIKIVNPSIYTSGTDGILIHTGAGDVHCMGGIIYQYGNSGSASRSIMVRPQLAYGDTTGVSTGKVVFIGTKLRGGGVVALRDDCSFTFLNPDINITNTTGNVIFHSLIQAGLFPIDIVVKDGEIKGTFLEAFDITNAPTRRYEIDNMYVQGYTNRGTNMIGASNLRFTNNDFPDATPYNIYGANAPLASYQGNNPNTNWENNIHSVVGVNVAVSASATTLAVTGLTQYDTKYSVGVSPAWNTTYWITGKSTTGFTINFGTAPSGASTLDWLIKR
jgi:hypothetical protein